MNIDANWMRLEDCKATWREEARTRALLDLKAEGLKEEEATERFAELYAEHYAELEKIGMDNIK